MCNRWICRTGTTIPAGVELPLIGLARRRSRPPGGGPAEAPAPARPAASAITAFVLLLLAGLALGGCSRIPWCGGRIPSTGERNDAAPDAGNIATAAGNIAP